jgi:DNA polymerase III delta subunit
VTTLVQEFELEQPEVIIVDDSFSASELAALLNLLPTFAEMRLVVLSNTENKLAVYEKREIQVNRLADLITTVRNGH